MKIDVVNQQLLDEFRAKQDAKRIANPSSEGSDRWLIELATFAVERSALELFSSLLGYSPGLAELLAWLDAREAEYDVVAEHEIVAPALGYHGWAARLLRFFQSQWAMRGKEIEELRRGLVERDERHHQQRLAIEDGARQEAERAREYLSRAEEAEAELGKLRGMSS